MNKQLVLLFFKVSRQTFKETKELVKDVIKQGFEKIKIQKLGREEVLVEAAKGSEKLSCEMDIAKNKMLQKTESSSYILLPFLPHQHSINIAEGDIKGTLKKLKSIDMRKDDAGNFREITQLQNFQTSNSYKRVKTPQGSQYYKQIDNTWQQLFHV